MNWITITMEDLLDTKLAALVEVYRSSGLGDSQDDPVNEITANVVARIRAEIQGCSRNVLDANPASIPQDLKGLAGRMVVREMQSRIQMPLTEDEREEMRNDLRYLERISRCEVPIAVPDVVSSGSIQSAMMTPTLRARTREFSRVQQDGV